MLTLRVRPPGAHTSRIERPFYPALQTLGLAAAKVRFPEGFSMRATA